SRFGSNQLRRASNSRMSGWMSVFTMSLAILVGPMGREEFAPNWRQFPQGLKSVRLPVPGQGAIRFEAAGALSCARDARCDLEAVPPGSFLPIMDLPSAPSGEFNSF